MKQDYIIFKMEVEDSQGGHKREERSSQTGLNSSRKRKAEDSCDVYEHVPQTISIMDYAKARATEMDALTYVSERVWAKKTLQVPSRHMRRRAASHNVKRLPRRLQEKAKKEMMKSGPPQVKKRPSRHHRRRPSNLVEDYARRARKNVWLETHIWHAKRFHMTNAWGYRIPLHPNDKGVRAAYRAVSHFCLLQDMSYMCCIELQGPERILLDQLGRLVSPDTGPSFGAARYIKGTREGSTVLYSHDSYPRNALGPAKFLWRPLEVSNEGDTSSTRRQFWLWVHPACYGEVMAELRVIFNIPVCSTLVENEGHSKNKPRSKLTQKSKNPKKHVDDVRPTQLETDCFTSGAITVTSLKDVMCRFSLSGPLSNAILTNLLQGAVIASTVKSQEEESKDQVNHTVKQNGGTGKLPAPGCNIGEAGDVAASENRDEKQRWWRNYFADKSEAGELHQCQLDLWKELQGLQSPGELGPHVVLGLTVRDPRISLPKKKTRVANDPANISDATLDAVKSWPADVASSPIWDTDIRNEVKATKLSEQELNKLRERHLVPGTQLSLGDDESRVPVLLIQNPGACSNSSRFHQSIGPGVAQGWGAGWDIILPQGWAMAFWLGLVYRGARVGGQKEYLSTSTQQTSLDFPESYPDTEATRMQEEDKGQQLEEKYNRMPPGKRPNYVKLGVVAPFRYPWLQLVRDWKMSTVQYSDGQTTNDSSRDAGGSNDIVAVLRSRTTLKTIKGLCLPTIKPSSRGKVVRKLAKSEPTDHVEEESNSIHILDSLKDKPTNLVAVSVNPIGRGTLDPFSMICIPTTDDLAELSKTSKCVGPMEPMHKDLKKLVKNDEKKLTETKKTEMSGTKSVTKGVKDSCSKKVIGFVKQGGYHFIVGQGNGLGFVVLEGLLSLLKNKAAEQPVVVLIRSSHSLQYRYATLSIIL